MAMQVKQGQNVESRFPSRILKTDSLFCLSAGAACVLESTVFAQWLEVSAAVMVIGGVILLASAIWLGLMTRGTVTRRNLQLAAWGNFAWVAFSIAVLILGWNHVTNEGRWLFALSADASLLLGLAESYAKRYIA